MSPERSPFSHPPPHNFKRMPSPRVSGCVRLCSGLGGAAGVDGVHMGHMARTIPPKRPDLGWGAGRRGHLGQDGVDPGAVDQPSIDTLAVFGPLAWGSRSLPIDSISEDRVRTLYTLSAGEVCRFAELRPDFGRHWSRKMGRSGAGDRPRTRGQRRPTPQVVAARGVFQQRLRLQEARESLPMPAFAANEDYRRLSICPCLPSIASALQRNFCRTRSRRTIVAQ